jgi:hypothetical protein
MDQRSSFSSLDALRTGREGTPDQLIARLTQKQIPNTQQPMAFRLRSIRSYFQKVNTGKSAVMLICLMTFW